MKVLKFRIIVLITTLAFMFSCSLDVNEDPDNPVDATIQQLLPTAQGTIAFRLSMSPNGLSQPAMAFMWQLTNFRYDGYGGLNSEAFDFEYQTLYSNGLTDNELVLNKALEQEAWHYVAIAQLQKAYTMSIIADLFGGGVYDEAFLQDDNRAPAYEDAAVIYPKLIALINEAKANIAREPGISVPGNEDLIYGGDMDKWSRMANSLLLKLYVQTRLINDVSSEINALIAEDNFITNASEDFEFRFGTSLIPENRHPGYLADWLNPTQKENQMNPFFFNAMFGDPRVPYYFYNQGGSFSGREFGLLDIGADADDATRTVPGLYPVGGLYDDGSSLTAGDDGIGSGDAAQRFIPSFNVKFYLAEAELMVPAVAGTSSAEDYFRQALVDAFAKVDQVASDAGAPALNATSVSDYIDNVISDYNTASMNEEKLEIMMTQKWIANFGNGIESYTDYRRTGYPELPDPDTDANPDSRTAGPYPLRFPYSETEFLNNTNAPDRIPVTTPVFWDNN